MKIEMNRVERQSKWVILTFLLFLTTACSGSLESERQQGNQPDSGSLNVDIGGDIELAIGSAPIAINSLVTGGAEPYTYAWSTQPVLFNEALSAEDAANIEFEIPEDVTTESTVLLTLKVTDANGVAGQAQINVSISPNNTLPIVTLAADDNDQVVDSGQGFNLNAEWIDAEDGENVAAAQIFVEQLSGITIENLPTSGLLVSFPMSDDSSPALAVIADNQFVNQSSSVVTLRFTLSVTDQASGIRTQSIDIDILPASESAPVVSAGNNKVVYEGELVTLFGSVSSNGISQFNWNQVDGEVPLTLVGAQNQNLQFTAPDVQTPTIYEFQFTATNSTTNRRNSDFVRVTVLPVTDTNGLNDTGVTLCADQQSNSVNCGLTSFPRQDAESGRDPAELINGLNKTGAGELGFDFSLLDENGEEIYSGTPSCIRDNVTGLIWEIKSTSGLRAHTHTFTWFDSGDTNGGIEGTQNSSQASCFVDTNISSCDTESYVNAVNSIGLCGANDWRLPRVFELASILNYGQTEDKMALGGDNRQLWPNHAKPDTPYWTSSSSVFGVSDPENVAAPRAWAINLSTGNEASRSKSNTAHVLLVR
ncbi:DUF1566 domain-containing protein [Catenovulum sediminis]|uniref:Lcl C-terminal domain-containing protein n=1 Tax=Catenovulum sediminis TaxID=1740262 RepID=UPI00117FD41D|nr:DUF1566 domain-containing protein [Catenovulum sediminis]